MKLRKFGRPSLAAVAAVALGLGMSACGGGTIGYMWVLGDTLNSAGQGQIAGYKIDDYTGNLTATVGSPYTSNGAYPVSVAVRPGGRYVYVVNAGVPVTGGGMATTGNLSVYTVGGDGILTFQTSYTTQGASPVWVTTDGGGSFVYVLDKYDPSNTAAGITNGTATGNGDVTVYSVNADTGRLTLVTNQQIKNHDGTQLNYFPVGKSPSMFRVATGGCLLTLDQGDQTIFPYTTSGAGQLTLTTNSNVAIGSSNATSINVGGNYVFVTDAGSNQILSYTLGNSCALSTVVGGATPNLTDTANPVNALYVAGSGANYLYVLNQSTTNSNNANSTISAFIVTATGQMQPVGGGTSKNNPYAVGSTPVCMVEDPSSKYLYTSNGDGTVTGKQLNKTTGELTDLARGTSFSAVGTATCLAVTGSID